MSIYRKLFILTGVILGIYLGFRYALPLLMPFLLGYGVARGAEPLVRLGTEKLGLPRAAASGVAVTLTLAGLLTVLTMAITFLFRELGVLADILPDMEQTARQGLSDLKSTLLRLAMSAPKGVRSLLTRSVMSLFGTAPQLSDTLSQYLPGMVTSLLARIPGSALTLGTAVISAFMISLRLPRLRDWAGTRLPQLLGNRILPTLGKLRRAAWKWFTAQCKLSGLCFCIVCVGLLLLGVSYAPLWAGLIAIVDALPILGAGVILLPWALVAGLQGHPALALGLTATFAAATLARTVMEPRVLGHHLGLDPLLTLGALYAGFQVWGFFGMILSPLLAVMAAELVKS